MKCSNCGNTELLEDDLFCGKCGTKVETTETVEIEDIVTDDVIEEIEVFEDAVEDVMYESDDMTDDMEESLEETTEAISEEIAEKTEEIENNFDEVPMENKSYKELEKLIDDENTNDKLEEALLDDISVVADELKTDDDVNTEENKEEKPVEDKEEKKKGTKLKVQLGLFVIGLLIILFGVIFVNKMANSKNGVLLIYSNGNLSSSKVGTTDISLVAEGVDEVAVQFSAMDKKGNLYYPKTVTPTEINAAEFTAYKNDGKEELKLMSNAEGRIYPNPDGTSVLNFKDVNIMYSQIIGDLHVYDYDSNTLIEKEVHIESVVISEDGKYAIFAKGENTDLYIYDFSKKSSKLVDEKIGAILEVDNKSKKIIYAKEDENATIENVSNLYSSDFNGKVELLLENVYNGEAGIFGDKIIFGRPLDEIPDYNEYLKDGVVFTDSEIASKEKVWESYFENNFFSIWEIDLDGKNERLISENVIFIDYASEFGKEVIYTKLKEPSEIVKFSGLTIDELSEVSNLKKVIYTGVDTKINFPSNMYEYSLYNNYMYDEKSKTLYSVYNNNLYSGVVGSEYDPELIETNVSLMAFNEDKLLYIKESDEELTEEEIEEGAVAKGGELYQYYKGQKLKLDSDVHSGLLFTVDEVTGYYKIGEEDFTLYRIINGGVKEIGKVATGLLSVQGDVLYFVDKDDNLMMSRKNKIDLIEKNVTSIELLD